jgi:DNA-3-methyladenine glycosylase I
MRQKTERIRCPWAGTDPLYVAYHDTEWGVPVHDERTHFEFLVLEGAQAGLSWSTILKKREAYRLAYRGFDPARVSRFGARDVSRLLADEGIVRNRKKIESSIRNARCFRRVQREWGSFDAYIWHFTGGRPVVNRRRTMAEIPAVTPLAEEVSRDLKSRGFSFVGPTIVYAHLQAIGIVNDHLVTCFRHHALQKPLS